VNKTELIEHIAKHADISKAAATRALESMIGAVKTTLKKAARFLWSVSALSQSAKGPLAAAATPAPAQRLKSRLPRFPSSARARRSRMR
jgi:hypothetical protein